MKIPVYQSEIDAGIAHAISSNASVNITTALKPLSNDDEIKQSIANNFDDFKLPHVKASVDDFDIYLMNSILVSVGWNKNDDVFDALETWVARATPVRKKLNYMHDERDIIGHIVASTVIDEKGKLVANDSDSVPDKFHIAISSVMWRIWDDPELTDRMEKIIAEIQQNKWFVSMECLFRNFDYVIASADGSQRIISRNAETAFLSKYLRRYGGEGVFEGDRIGRLLRNFAFSGVGIVDQPANEESIIFTENFNPFKVLKSNINIKEKTNMSDNTPMLEEFKQRALAAEAKADKMQDELQKQVEAAQKAERDKLEKEIASHVEAIDKLTEDVKAKSDELDAAKSEKEALEKKVSDLEESVATLEAEKSTAARKAKLVEAGASDERATELVTKWADASDAQFDEVVAMVKEVAEFDMKKKEEEKKKKEAQASNNVDDDDADDKADANLDDVEEEEDIATAVDESDSKDELQAATAKWFGEVLKHTAKSEE